MKKTWLFGMAFALGMSNIPVATYAQYASTPYGSSALAPSGYALSGAYSQPNLVPASGENVQSGPYGQPSFLAPPPAAQQVPAQYAVPSLQSEYGPASVSVPSSVPAQLVRYPQEPIPAPAFEAQQAPEQGWVGPNGGQYQAVPTPPPAAPGQSGPSADPYANAIAPTATGGAVGCATGACGSVYPTVVLPGRAGGWLAGHAGVPGKAWFAGGGALFFRRVDDRSLALTYDTAMPTPNVLSTGDARQTRLNGFEVFTGRYFNCGRNAFMVNYWGLFPADETATVIVPGGGNYRPRYSFNGLEMPGQSVYDWYDSAYSHRIVRSSEYHNVEANLLGFAVGGAARTWGCTDACGCGDTCSAFTGPCNLTPNVCGSRLNLTWLAGVRWFRFSDNLQYSASENDSTYNGSADDIYFDNNVRNDLVGFQLGGAATYCCGKRFNLYTLSKAGIYNNHSQLYSRIGTNGSMPDTAVVDSANAYDGNSYLINASQNNAAVLGEIGTGVGARISRGWSANVGYRVIGAAGVATAVNTIPMETIHLGNVADYNTNSSLILHGVTLGGTYNF